MYDINNKTEAVRAMQEMLSGIDGYERVVPNGAMDKKTLQAVNDFKTQIGKVSDSVVDKDTQEQMYREHAKSKRKRQIKSIFRGENLFPIKRGSFGSDIMSINQMMSALLNKYGKQNGLRPSRVFGKFSSEACIELCKIYLLEEKDYLDEELLYMIYTDYVSL